MSEPDVITAIAVGYPDDVVTLIAALTSSDPRVVAVLDHLAVLVRLADPEAMDGAETQIKLSNTVLNSSYEYGSGSGADISGMRIIHHLHMMKTCFVLGMQGRDRGLPSDVS